MNASCQNFKPKGRIAMFGKPKREERLCFFCDFLWLAAILASLLTCVFGQAESNPWLILASGGKGAINSHTTREDLVRLYGESNVVDHDADVGDGEMEPETVLFPNDPERRIEILWKDPVRRAEPSSVAVRGKISRWHAVRGISLGTTSSQLQRVNGRPFRWTLTNDGTDMAQELISWRGGVLEKELQADGRVILSLEYSPTKRTKPRGPSDFSLDSDSPVMRTQNPSIHKITWVFPSKAQP
jgi:hypothetical protein